MGGLYTAYSTINEVSVAAVKSGTVVATGKNGILLGFEALWWPRIQDPETGQGVDARIFFYLVDAQGNQVLGTQASPTSDLIGVSKEIPIYSWQHPDVNMLLYAGEWLRRMSVTGSEDFVGKFVNGLTIFAQGYTAITAHISFQALYMEFD